MEVAIHKSAKEIAAAIVANAISINESRRNLETAVDAALQHFEHHKYHMRDYYDTGCCKQAEYKAAVSDQLSDVVERLMPFALITVLNEKGFSSETFAKGLFYSSWNGENEGTYYGWIGGDIKDKLGKFNMKESTQLSPFDFTYRSVGENLARFVEGGILTERKLQVDGRFNNMYETFYAFTEKGREVAKLVLETADPNIEKEKAALIKTFRVATESYLHSLYDGLYDGKSRIANLEVINLLLKIKKNQNLPGTELVDQYREILWKLLWLCFIDFENVLEVPKTSIPNNQNPDSKMQAVFSITEEGMGFLSNAQEQYGTLTEILRATNSE